ncbi:cytochrome c oxidase subunit NDUFA4-like isoform X1 [Pseudochaenichthys georgianus]|uniref:cytochrome c oxidase subunit NDUFA4-like isoform X1 n=1 Tax=Pseudochaenichthys georgianus TaxID=52239 RepID=UPI00146F508C|nr:cytochrome c oxidase subunit NDUFA4 isoform X1 [Pseudochaenichthys georgianus]
MIKTMVEQARRYPGLIPQLFFLGMGLTGATFYLIRLARGPHVTLWDKKNNPEPWNNLDPTYQYKVASPPHRDRASDKTLSTLT